MRALSTTAPRHDDGGAQAGEEHATRRYEAEPDRSTNCGSHDRIDGRHGLVACDGVERLQGVMLCAGGRDAILHDAEDCERCNEREHDKTANHGPIIGLGRLSFGRNPCFASEDQEEPNP